MRISDWSSDVCSSDLAYQKWQEGYSFGQEFGYLVDYSNGNGFFNTAEELANSDLKFDFGTPRVGDLKYQDLNGDGSIDERDKAPLGYGAITRIVYGISGGITFISFDLTFLFQCLGPYSPMLDGMGIWGTDYDGYFGFVNHKQWNHKKHTN